MTDALLATCWTTAGDPLSSPDLRSPHSLAERITAAAQAGFTGFGILSSDLAAAEREYGLARIRALLTEHGMTEVELEAPPNWPWWLGDEADETRRLLLRGARELTARHIKVTAAPSEDPQWDEATAVRSFARLAEQAGEVGSRLAVEFLPWSTVRDVRDALDMVGSSGALNAGIIVDIWHVERLGVPLEELSQIPVDQLFGVELCDAEATMTGGMFEDTMNRRRYCGEGDFDLPGFIGAIRSAGWAGPWGVEILSEEHRRQDFRTATERAAHSARQVLHRGP